MSAMRKLTWLRAAGPWLLLLGVAAWLGLRLTPHTGYTHDDAIYLVTAKALALGQGYRQLGVPGQPFMIGFPPLYPLVLSLIWHGLPAFPANLVALKLVNWAAALATIALTFAWSARAFGCQRLGYLTAGLVTLSCATAFVDVIASDVLYMALVMLAVWYLEPRLAETRDRRWPAIALMAVLTVLPAMVRSSGLALEAAVIGYLLLARRWRLMARMAVAIAVFNLPWQGWIAYLRHTGANVSWDYMGWIRQYSGGLTIARELGWIASNATLVAKTGLFAVLAPIALDQPLGAAATAHHAGFVLPALGLGVLAVAVCGYAVRLRAGPRIPELLLALSLAMILVFPYSDTLRYVSTLAPLMIFYLVAGAAWLSRAGGGARRLPAGWGRLALALAIAAPVASGLGGAIAAASAVRHHRFFAAALAPEVRDRDTDLRLALAWIDRVAPRDALIVYDIEPIATLLTGHEALSYGVDDAEPNEAFKRLLRERNCYMVLVDAREPYTTWLRRHPARFDRVYRSPAGTTQVFHLSQDWPAAAAAPPTPSAP